MAILVRRLPRIVVLALLCLFTGFPLYWMYNTATSDASSLVKGQQTLWPRVNRTGQIFAVFTSGVPIVRWLGNSAVIAAGTTLLSIALGVLAAYGLSRYKFYGKGLVSFALFATQMFPTALLVVPLYAIFAGLGLLNNLGGLVLADTAFALPVAAWIMKTAMDKIPYEIEEASRVDGCTALGSLLRIVIPLALPSIAAAAVITFFEGWNEYLFALTFVNDQSRWPASKGLGTFVGEYITPLPTVLSAALVFSLPAVIFFLLVQRQIVSGLTAGSVKG